MTMKHNFEQELATVKKRNDPVEQITKEELTWRINELKKCHDDPIYFANNYFRIISPDVNEGRGGLGVIKTYPKQNDLINFFRNYNRCVVLSVRQSGKSTSYNIFCLWYLCFYGTTRIMLLAQREKTAIELLGRLRMAYEYLPAFLKPAIVTYNKSSIEFSNYSKIEAFATASQGSRGASANILIVDECAFIPDNIANDFMASVYPTVSRDKNAKVIFVSTPNGASDKNLFYHTWKIAGDSDPNDINAWQRFRMDWWDVPGRDDAWMKNQLKTIGEERFRQEFGNEFIGSGAIRLFTAPIIENARRNRIVSPQTEVKMASMAGENTWNIRIWDRPKSGHIYIASADIAEGIGGDSSVLFVFDITDMSNIKLALSFANPNISIAEFAALSARMLNCYNCPIFLAEDNGVGAGYLSILNEHYGYRDILKYDNESIGVHSTTKTKMDACLWAKDALDLFNIKLADDNLINQMEVFSRTSSKSVPSYAAIRGEHDDYTLALIWGLYLLKTDVMKRQKRYDILDTKCTSLGTNIITHIVDSDSLNPHFVSQFMEDPLKNELMNGTSGEILIPWWNVDDNTIIQTSREVETSMPFFVIGANDSGYTFDDEPEFGRW